MTQNTLLLYYIRGKYKQKISLYYVNKSKVRGSNPGAGEIFRTCPDRPWGPLSLLYNGYRVFAGGKERPGRDADPSSLLVPWSRKGRAIPLLPLRAVRPVQSLNTHKMVHFTFTFLSQYANVFLMKVT